MKTLIAILMGAACAAAWAQQAPPPKPEAAAPEATIRTNVDEVLLDVVFRDKKGKVIKDLDLNDVEVIDNGVKQKVTGFRFVEGAEAIEKGAHTALDPLRQLRLVTLVFERLGEDPRRMARQASLELIKGDSGPNTFYSVVVIDGQLYMLQPFTKDKAALKKAVESATSGQFSLYAGESDRIKSQLRQVAVASNNPSATAFAGGDASARISSLTPLQPSATQPPPPANSPAGGGGDFVGAKLAQVMLDMTRFEASISTQESTRTSIMALLSLVRGQYQMPGRKTMLYFSQGLYIPTNLDEAFRTVISTANRGNVSFYAVDTRGVQIGAQNQATAQQLQEAMNESAKTSMGESGTPVTMSQARAQDTAEGAMRNNTQIPLRDLAEATGGFLIGESNDFRKPLQKVTEEIAAYYEIAYNPGIENYDGRFRKTDIKLARANVVPHGRSGYFALPPDVRASGLMPFEIPLLKALGTAPLPKELEYRSAAIRFQPLPQGARTTIFVEVPLGSLSFAEDKTANTFKARLSMLALVKNASGDTVQKYSRDLPLNGPTDKLAAMKVSNFIFKEQLDAAPGRYTLETAVVDRETGKVAAKRAAFVIPGKTAGVSLSNITLVRTFQPNAPGLDANDPFQFQGGRITPTLSPIVRSVKGALLAMFFVVYPDPAIAEKPKVVVEYIKDGMTVGQGAIELPAADAMGRIPYVMSSPADAMPAGSYEIRTIVTQGTSKVEDRAFVNVEGM